jgi:predicted membrane chloride channel (bestrophin family)
METIIFGTVLITITLSILFIWVTNKAYSRRWEDDADETRGQF